MMQQAVLEFDEAVRVPWRPPLRSAASPRAGDVAGARRPPLTVARAVGDPPAARRGAVGAVGATAARGRTAAAGRVHERDVAPLSGREARPRRPAGGPAPSATAGDAAATPARPAGGGRPAPHRAVAPVRREGRGSARVRLTRRGRLAVLAAALLLGGLLGAWLGSVAAGGGEELRLAGRSGVVVQAGDTLWSIAAARNGVDGAEDVRTLVDRIQQLNHLDGTALQPGQVLQLP